MNRFLFSTRRARFSKVPGPKSNIQIKYSKSARILAYKQFYFVLLTNSFILLSEKLLKHLSGIKAATFRAR